MSDPVIIRSPRGQIVYQDSSDHFENGLLRLLGLDRESFASWLSSSEASSASELLARLAHGFRALRSGLAPRAV